MIIKRCKFSTSVLAISLALFMTGTLKGQTQPQTNSLTPDTPETQVQEPRKKTPRPSAETPTPERIEDSIYVPEQESGNDASQSQQDMQKTADLMYQQIQRSLDSAMVTFKAGPLHLFLTVSMSEDSDTRTRVSAQDPSKVGFNATQVDQFFEKTKSHLLQQLNGEDLAALRAYIKREYPKSEMKRSMSPYYQYVLVSRAEVEIAFLEIRRFIERLKKYFAERSKVLVNLAISSEPDNATFVMWPDGGSKRETTTNNVMANISRGLYIYKVTKPGHKDIVSTIDLVRESGTSLRCTFNKSNDKDGPHPCQVK